MAHIPMDDVRQLWDETSERSWPALSKTLQEHKGIAQGISDVLVDEMMAAAQNLDNEGQPYPESPKELYDALNKETGM